MTIGFREREKILDLFESITGLRMNHAYSAPAASRRICRAGAWTRSATT